MNTSIHLILIVISGLLGFKHQLSAQQIETLESVLYSEEFNQCNTTAEIFDSVYFNLPKISTSPYKSHIRLNDKGRIYDLYCDENQVYSGVFVAFTYEYRYRKIENSDREQSYIHQIFFKKYQLDSLLVKRAFEYVDSIKLLDVPTDTLILNWQKGFLHCDGLLFESSMNNIITRSIFSCPWGQNDSLPEKHIVLSTLSKFSILFDSKEKYKALESQLPMNATYSNDGYLFWNYWDHSIKKKKRIRRKQQRP